MGWSTGSTPFFVVNTVLCYLIHMRICVLVLLAWLLAGCDQSARPTSGPPSSPPDPTWVFRTPLPQPHFLFGVWGSDPDNLVAVGDAGTVLVFDGTGWARTGLGVLDDFEDVWGADAANIFAVGEDGVIWFFDGAAWSQMPSGTSVDLWDVWGSGADDVFAVGERGVILHFNGNDWLPMSSNSTALWRGVWGAAGDDVFVVGTEGSITHFDGNDWSAMPHDLTTATLRSVWGAAHDDVWAVGDNGTILHYDTAWAKSGSFATDKLQSVFGTAPDNVYAVGNSSSVVRFDGSSWQTISLGGVDELWDVFAFDPTTVFVAGGVGILRKWDGMNFTQFNRGSDAVLHAVVSTSAGDFAFGTEGTILNSGPDAWQPSPPVTNQQLLAAWAYSNDFVVAVGTQGAIVEFDGSDWQAVASPTVMQLRGVWGTSPDHVIAVGDEVLLQRDANSWSVLVQRPGDFFTSVDGHGSNAYVAGDSGKLIRYDGSSLTLQDTGTILDLFDVFVDSNEGVACVGASGLAITNRTGLFQSEVVFTGRNLLGVDGRSLDDLYVVGDLGVIRHFDGESWQRMVSPTTLRLQDVVVTDGRVLAAGWYGSVISLE